MKCAALLIVLILVGVAHAEDKKLAERHYKLGAKAYAAQSFEAAATNFDEAYKNYNKPEIAFSAAQAYRRLYQVDPKPQYVRRAVELYEVYLGAVKTGGRVGDAADSLLDMKRELAKLEAAGVTAGSLTVAPRTRLGINITVLDQVTNDAGALREIGDVSSESTLPGMKATIDGKPVEPYALVEVEARDHVISVVADGYFPVEKRGVAIENQATYIDVELKPKPAKLTVKSEGDARIAVDGRTVGTTPTAAVELAAGKHLVSVLRRGREPWGREITVTRGQELVLDAALAKTSRRKAVPWVFTGAGILAGGAVATGLYALSRDRHASELRDQITMMGNQAPGVADELDRTVRARDRFVTWTWVLGAAAVATGGIGGFLLVFDRPDADSGTVGVGGRF
jgi:hypothetical protein